MKFLRYVPDSKRLMIRQIIQALHKILYSFFGVLAVLNYTTRKLLFGTSNALNYLSRVHDLGCVLILRLNGAKIGSNCNIQSGIILHNCKNFKNLKIGDNCHIGKNCFFDLRDSVTIEDNVVISMFCRFVTHIDMTNSALNDEFPATTAPIRVGANSYLGIGSTVLMGVKIGSNVLVGASSLVNNNLADNCRVAGIPCGPIS